MIRIAVCDDEENTARLHQDKIREILSENRTVYETALYTRSDNLLSDIMEDGFFYDILLLDIEMPGTDGMEIAEKIRPYLPDVKIIFITSHIEYAIDAYELSVFRYVPKNDLDRRLPAAILDAVKQVKESLCYCCGNLVKEFSAFDEDRSKFKTVSGINARTKQVHSKTMGDR